MAETATKLPVKSEAKESERTDWRPFDSLRREVDRLFEDFHWRPPFRRRPFEVEPIKKG